MLMMEIGHVRVAVFVRPMRVCVAVRALHRVTVPRTMTMTVL